MLPLLLHYIIKCQPTVYPDLSASTCPEITSFLNNPVLPWNNNNPFQPVTVQQSKNMIHRCEKSNQFLLRLKKQVLRSPFQEEYDNLILLYFFTYLYFLQKPSILQTLCTCASSLALVPALGKPFPCHVQRAFLLQLMPWKGQAAKEGSSLPGGLREQVRGMLWPMPWEIFWGPTQ